MLKCLASLMGVREWTWSAEHPWTVGYNFLRPQEVFCHRCAGAKHADCQLDVGRRRRDIKVPDKRAIAVPLHQVPTHGEWMTVRSAESSGATTAEETYDFPDVPARWVRYLGHGSSIGTWNSVTEVSLFAVP